MQNQHTRPNISTAGNNCIVVQPSSDLSEGLLREVALSSLGVDPVDPLVRTKVGPRFTLLAVLLNYEQYYY